MGLSDYKFSKVSGRNIVEFEDKRTDAEVRKEMKSTDKHIGKNWIAWEITFKEPWIGGNS